MTDGANKKNTDTQPEQETDIIDVEVVKEEAAPSPESTTSAPKSRKTSKSGWVTSAILTGFIGGLYAAPYFKEGLVAVGLLPKSPPVVASASVDLSPLETSLTDLKAEITRHREILAQHESQISSATESRNNLSEMLNSFELKTPAVAPETDVARSELALLKAATERLSNDVARLAALNTETNPAVAQLTGSLALLKAETEQISSRFSTLETALTEIQAGALDASPRGRLLLALTRIKERSLNGLSFTSELEALRPDISALSTIDQQLIGAELAVLQKASSGIKTYEELSNSFDAMAATALQSAQKEDGTFLSNLFTVRRTDAGASGNDAIFMVAERRLARRDMVGTITELEKLEGAALTSTELWRSQAEQFSNTSRAFERIISTITNSQHSTGGQP